MTLKEAREKLHAKQDALAKIMEKAKVDGQIDMDKVPGPELDLAVEATTLQKVEKFRERQKELNDLFDVALKLAEIEEGHKALDQRMQTPAGGGNPGQMRHEGDHKSVGMQLVESKAYTEYKKNRQMGIISQLDFGITELKGLNDPYYELKALFERGAGWSPETIRLPGFVEKATRPVQLLDIIPSGNTGQSAIKYMEETTRTHNAAEKAEGVDYAESAFALTERSQSVEKVTDSVPTTDEQLEDEAQARSYLTERLQFGLRQKLDSQAANGSGVAPQLKGILAHAIQTQAKGADPVPDAFYRAMTKVRFTGRAMPTHHVVHPNDWQDVRLLRTADGIYIWGNPSEAGPERMWGLPVVQNDALAEGTALVGSFLPPWIMMFDRRGVDVQVGYVSDQFKQGRLTIRADLRAALVVFRAAAFCSVTGI